MSAPPNRAPHAARAADRAADRAARGSASGSASGFGRFLRRRLARGVPYGLGFTLAVVALVAALWGFLAVVDSVTDADDLARSDAHAHDAVYEAVGPERLGLVRAVTFLGNNATLVTAVTLLCLAFIVRRRYGWAFRLLLASGGGGLVVTGLKLLFARDRPLEQVVPAHGYSLPSGHAFAATVFYGMLAYLVVRATRRTSVRVPAVAVCGLVIAGVGLSRVYLNVHYLTDVVAGWAAGAAWLVATQLVVSGAEHHAAPRGTPPEAPRDAV